MRPPLSHHVRGPSQGPLMGSVGSCARVTLSWTVAGGIAGGGIVVSLLTLAGSVSPGFQLLAAPILFLIGTALGFMHGAGLATVGRPVGLTRGGAIRRCLLGGLMAIPAVAIGWIVTAGISLTAAIVHEYRASLLVLSLGGWIFGLALCGWAVYEGVIAVRRAVERWPESRAGSVLAVGLLVVLSALFVRYPPQIVGTGLRVNGLGAVALAAGATLWIGFPLLILVLHLTQSRLMPHSGGGEVGT